MGDEIIFTVGKELVVQGSQKVVIEGFLEWHVNGEVRGSLDIEVDFSDLDPVLHADAVRTLMNSRRALICSAGVAHAFWPEEFDLPPLLQPPPPPRSLLKSLWSWVADRFW